MSAKSTDTIINYDIAVDVHIYRKKATKEDRALAKKLSDQATDLFFKLLTHYVNGGDKKYEFYQVKKGNYAVRELQ